MQTMKKWTILLLLAVLAALPTQAETIKGHVIDQNGNPMPFVTISVLAQDSTLITGAITDDDGKYEGPLRGLPHPRASLHIHPAGRSCSGP